MALAARSLKATATRHERCAKHSKLVLSLLTVPRIRHRLAGVASPCCAREPHAKLGTGARRALSGHDKLAADRTMGLCHHLSRQHGPAHACASFSWVRVARSTALGEAVNLWPSEVLRRRCSQGTGQPQQKRRGRMPAPHPTQLNKPTANRAHEQQQQRTTDAQHRQTGAQHRAHPEHHTAPTNPHPHPTSRIRPL